MDSNQISEIKGLETCTNLEDFYLRESQISEIKGLKTLTNLTTLSLAKNQISEIKGLEALINLTNLYLYDNKIREVKGLETLPQLIRLDLRENKIHEIPLFFLALKKRIDWFQKYGYNKSEGMYIAKNPIIPPPPEIIQQGNKAIQTFLEELQQTKPLNETKVILVGQGASGKTSLVKRLLKQDFDPKEKQTHGINIFKKSFPVEGESLRVNFWDFGGQEIMHATHQFFLTKRCLYVLVLDSRKDAKAEYWLKYIENFGGNAPVLVVLNKMDENPSFEVNREFLSQKYPAIQNYYKISCQNGEGIAVLKKDLLQQLWNLELRNTPFPTHWWKVKDYFQRMKKDYISYRDYQEVCRKHHVHKPHAQDVLLSFLNDLGIVLNYQNLKKQQYFTQVLNPLWLTNAVYRVINSPKVAATNGQFAVEELGDIINDTRYQQSKKISLKGLAEIFNNTIYEQTGKTSKNLHIDPEQFRFIVAMMEEFELTYQMENRQYMIPELLPTKQQLYDFGGAPKILRFIIEYPDFLPTAIVPRLIVKMHKYIYANQVWKTGMVLEEQLIFKSIANVVLDEESQKFIIEIAGERCRDFLTFIRETVKDIHKDYQHLEVAEWIPLPDLHKGEELLVEYDELLGYEESNMDTYFSGKLKKKYSVSDLLNGVENPEHRKEMPLVSIFVSYAEEDEDFKNALSKHLKPLTRLKKATLWDAQCILAGTKISKERNQRLEEADIVLCLISANFISTDFAYDVELKEALKAHKQGKKVVVPIRVKECLCDELPVFQLKSLPAKDWVTNVDNESAWTEVARGIEEVIERMQEKKMRGRRDWF